MNFSYLERPGHARLLAKELEIDRCDGIVIVSGDGLVHEVDMMYLCFNIE